MFIKSGIVFLTSWKIIIVVVLVLLLRYPHITTNYSSPLLSSLFLSSPFPSFSPLPEPPTTPLPFNVLTSLVKIMELVVTLGKKRYLIAHCSLGLNFLVTLMTENTRMAGGRCSLILSAIFNPNLSPLKASGANSMNSETTFPRACT
jgi:hypothetical protein